MAHLSDNFGSGECKISYSQNFEDVYIDRVFPEIDNGFYIDIGAYHPSDDSVTKYFYDKGWSGINVEPGNGFAMLACRERDINVNLAISDRSGPQTFIIQDEAPGTSRLAGGPVANSPSVTTLTVDCVTLEELVQQHVAGRHVHFLKLDIEGAEDAVIRGTDWRRFRPELLVVESTLPMTNTRCDENWRQHLMAMDFREVFFDGINVYYLRVESLHRGRALDRPINVLDGFVRRGRADHELDGLKRHCAWLEEYRDKLEGDIAREIAMKENGFASLTEQREATEATLTTLNTDYRWLKDQHDALSAHAAAEANRNQAHVAWLRDLLRRTEEDRDIGLGEIGELRAAAERRQEAFLTHMAAEVERYQKHEAWLREVLRRTEEDRDIKLGEIGKLRAALDRQQADYEWLLSEFARVERDRDWIKDSLYEPERQAGLEAAHSLAVVKRDLAEQRTIRGAFRWFVSPSRRRGLQQGSATENPSPRS